MTDLAFAEENRLLGLYADLTGAPVLEAEAYPEDITPIDTFAVQFLKQHNLLPLGVEQNQLSLLAAVPISSAVLDAVRQFVNLPVRLFLGRAADIQARIDQVYQAGVGAYQDIYRDAAAGMDGDNEEDVEALKTQAEDAPVVRLVQLIITNAVDARASDIHLEIYENQFKVRYRIDGVLYDMESPPRRMFLPTISHLKLRARMNIAERRLPQDGRIKKTVHNREIDMRVSTIPTVYGESMVIRILDQGPRLLDLEALGFPHDTLTSFTHFVHQPHGMILVTGPTGSGKTTALYGALRILNTPQNKIITVEDPVEYQIDGINQMQVKPQIDLTFANALRSIVRQDPDIIMVGEIRDLETAEIAIKAAQTGHMVLSTLHTNDAPQTLTRLMNMGVPTFNIASSILLITAQRLARRLCNCKKPMSVPQQALLDAGFKEHELDGSWTLYGPGGCDRCKGSGFKGRVGIYQVMPVSEAMQRLIMSGATALDLAAQAKSEGVKDLRESGLLKVKQGVTSLDEVLSTTNA